MESATDAGRLEYVRWHGDGTAILELEVTRPLVEWLELEADAAGLPLAEWATERLQCAIDGGLISAGNRASSPIETPATDDIEADLTTGLEPPESVRWHDYDDRGTLMLEVSHALVEELEEKPEPHDWALMALWLALRINLEKAYGPEVDVTVNVSEEFARRISLWVKHHDMEGDPAHVADLVVENLSTNYTWTLDGEPWILVEGIGEDD